MIRTIFTVLMWLLTGKAPKEKENPAPRDARVSRVDGRWAFEMKTTLPGGRHVSKVEAWRACVQAGVASGIPEHGWRARHGSSGYKWVTRVPQ